jgi:arylsulfatase A-like enzyme
MRALVIAVSGFHAGYLGCYGNDWVETPVLDRLAAGAVVFDRHYADRPDAAGAWHAWRTGRYHMPSGEGAERSEHGVEPDLFELLRVHGVAVSIISDEPAILPESLGNLGHAAVPGERLGALKAAIGGASQALHGDRDHGPRLVWLRLSTLLSPWSMADVEPEEEDESPESDNDRALQSVRHLQTAYAHTVHHLDAGLAPLLDELEPGGRLGDLLVVVTSEHGMALGERGVAGSECRDIHEEWLHVPLILYLPGGAEAGRRVLALSQSVDLLPTLLDFFSIPVPPEVHGRSLRSLASGESNAIRPYACAGIQVREAALWALRTPDWSYLLRATEPSGRLYVQPDDRWEVNNVVQHHLELAEHLGQVLRGFIQASRQPGALCPPPLRNLEAELAAPIPQAPPIQGDSSP